MIADTDTLDPALFDNDRFKRAVELAIWSYPDQELIWRLLWSGASLFCKREGERLVISVAYGEDRTGLLGVLRGAPEPIEPLAEDLDRIVEVIRLHPSVVQRPPQG